MMWRQINLENTPDALVDVTSSLWQYDEVARVGVMRGSSLLVPPYLWAEIYQSSFKLLRKGNELLTELQQIIRSPIVLAETCEEKNADFLRLIGFELIGGELDRQLFKRSIF